MRVRNITLDEDENPDRVLVEMTLDEAAMMLRLVGRLSPRMVLNALGDHRWYNASSDIYSCLAGSVFNRFWDGGVDDVIPRWKEEEEKS